MQRKQTELRAACDALISEERIDPTWSRYDAVDNAPEPSKIDLVLPQLIAQFQDDYGKTDTAKDLSRALNDGELIAITQSGQSNGVVALAVGAILSFAVFYALLSVVIPALALIVACAPLAASLYVCRLMDNYEKKLDTAEDAAKPLVKALQTVVTRHDEALRGASAALETGTDFTLAQTRMNVLWGTTQSAADTIDAARDQIDAALQPARPASKTAIAGEGFLYFVAASSVALAGGVMTGHMGWAIAQAFITVLAAAIGWQHTVSHSRRAADRMKRFVLDIFDRGPIGSPAPATALRALNPTLHLARASIARQLSQESEPRHTDTDVLVERPIPHPAQDIRRVRLATAPMDDAEGRMIRRPREF